MRRAAMVCLAMLLTAPAMAEGVRLAVIYTNYGTASYQDVASARGLNILRRNGVPYDIYSVGTRTWGTGGVDDSTWFRQRYAAILIPYMDGGQAAGVPVRSQEWASKFQNKSAHTGLMRGPLGGRWSIPVFVICPQGMTTSNSYDDNDSTNNYYVCGATANASTFFRSSAVGTYRSRQLVRLDGSKTDTLYSLPAAFACRPTPWTGNGTVAALAWADTIPPCTGSDTLMTAWRFRPAGGPGVYYSLEDETSVSNMGMLMMLQFMFANSEVHALRKIKIPLMQHDVEVVSLTSFQKAMRQRLMDTLTVNRIGSTYATPTHPNEYVFYDAASLASIRPGLTSGLARWTPFTNTSGWSGAFYNASDTAGVRTRLNQVMRTATRADSMGFPVGAMATRLVTSGGISGAWLGGLYRDAGFRVIETLDYVPNASGWTHVGDNNNVVAASIPGVGETRTIYVQGTYGFLHDSTFTALRGSELPYEYVGKIWMQALNVAAVQPKSIYWHTNTVCNNIGDPYFSWLLSVANRTVRLLNRVIEWDNGFANQTAMPRNTYTSR